MAGKVNACGRQGKNSMHRHQNRRDMGNREKTPISHARGHILTPYIKWDIGGQNMTDVG